MSTLTVKAMDSTAAMDEIVSKLGPDAVILSTTKIDGKVVMEASIGARQSQNRSPDEKGFANILSEKMINSPNNNTGGTHSDYSMPTAKEIQNLQQQITKLKQMLDGLYLTDFDGINQNLTSNSRVTLQQAGFSPEVLNDFKTSYLGYNYADGCNRFLSDLSAHLTFSDCDALLSNKFIFVIGQSGTGRTTMVGKLTAYLKESFSKKDLITAEIVTGGQRNNGQLQDFCRLLNSQVFTIGPDTPFADFNQIRKNEIMVVDLALPLAQATEKLTEIMAVVGKQNVGIVLTVPASTSANMIQVTSNLTNNLAPIIALTKLDECDISTAEFSSFATIGAKIGLLSASRSMADAPLFASESILMQYLRDNLIARTDCNSDSHRLEA
jgi:flagellar biosynthesis GTPase FlhF